MRILSLIFVLLSLASSIYAETCPEAEDLFPCNCEEDDDFGVVFVECSDEEMTLEDLKHSLNALSGKDDVDLSLDGLQLGKIPSNFFDGIGIKKLEISHCELDSLSDDGRSPLLGLETTLEELNILASFTEENVPASLKVGHLQRLKELDLSYNVITELSDDWFDRGPASLEYLVISNNGIERIGNRAFANLINLKELSIDGNRFGPMKRSFLPKPAKRLVTLELDNNALTSIPEDFFRDMPALTEISLRSNGIVRLEQRTWQSVWQQLQIIRLEGNPIECDSHMNWIFSLRKTSAIYGKCYAPKEFEGDDLQEFLDSRTRV